MKIPFSKKAANLHDSCIKTLGIGKYFWTHTRAFEEWGGNIGYDLFDKDYEAIIWINGEWQLVKDGYLFALNNISLEELCEYTDQIITNIQNGKL